MQIVTQHADVSIPKMTYTKENYNHMKKIHQVRQLVLCVLIVCNLYIDLVTNIPIDSFTFSKLLSHILSFWSEIKWKKKHFFQNSQLIEIRQTCTQMILAYHAWKLEFWSLVNTITKCNPIMCTLLWALCLPLPSSWAPLFPPEPL